MYVPRPAQTIRRRKGHFCSKCLYAVSPCLALCCFVESVRLGYVLILCYAVLCCGKLSCSNILCYVMAFYVNSDV